MYTRKILCLRRLFFLPLLRFQDLCPPKDLNHPLEILLFSRACALSRSLVSTCIADRRSLAFFSPAMPPMLEGGFAPAQVSTSFIIQMVWFCASTGASLSLVVTLFPPFPLFLDQRNSVSFFLEFSLRRLNSPCARSPSSKSRDYMRAACLLADSAASFF